MMINKQYDPLPLHHPRARGFLFSVKKVVLHSYTQILFVSQIPHLEHYLKGTLEGFFHNRNYVYNEFTKLRTEMANNNN